MTSSPSEQDAAALYARLQPQLERILTVNLRPPAGLIDDACQTAWSQWLEHRAGVEPGRELGWLATTAMRAALRLMRAERDLGLGDDSRGSAGAMDHASCEPGPEGRVALREAIGDVRRLPVRQQRVVMLRVLGYRHEEIAAVTGETRRAVKRQLGLARRTLLGPAGRAGRADEAGAGRETARRAAAGG